MQILACVWGVAALSLTMTAGASLRKSTEPLHRFSLTQFQQFLLPCPFPRLLLLRWSKTALEAEVRDALRIRQQEREPGIFFELTCVDPTLLFDFLAVLDLLDHVRSGYFDMVHIVPSAATWSRSRHSGHSGQPLPPLKIFSIRSSFAFAR